MSSLSFGFEFLGIIILIVFIGFWIGWRFLHFPTPHFVRYILDNRIRIKLQKPTSIADRLMLEPNFTVMDLGCGPGTFTFEIANRLSADSTVLAVDIQPKMVRVVKTKVSQKRLANITPIIASASELPIRAQSLDRVAMVTVLAEISNRIGALNELRRVLKQDGILSISEFLPDPDYPLRRTVKKWCGRAGFQTHASFGTFFTYTLNFEKAILNNS
ncbi:MAG: class I SAM-dependent methyltransferase [Candidatus Heimdallarchaeota archaeon]